jgi:hypothetical protein
MWTLDVNRDAQVDVAITHQTEPVALLVNHSEPKGDWLELALVGTDDSRDAIGALVEVSVGERSWKTAQVSGDGYLCSDERVLRFGLGDVGSHVPVTLKVTWPNGETEEVAGVTSNSRWQVTQGERSAFELTP